MRRDVSIAVALAVAVVAAVAGLAFREARADRAALVEAFGGEHLARLRIGIAEIEAELSDVEQHLQFAARLVESARSGDDQRRELEALLAVVRAYRMIAVYDGGGRRLVAAFDPTASPALSSAPFDAAMEETARAASARRRLAVSPPLGDSSGPAWHRAFAEPIARDGGPGAVAVLLDMEDVFERLRRVAPDASARLVLLEPDGAAAPLTDPALARAVGAAGPRGRFGDLLDRMRLGLTGSVTLPEAESAALGMGGAEAVAVFAPISVGKAGHWAAAVVGSTAGLRTQERSILVRAGALGGAVALASAALAAYLVVTARRTIAVRERLRSAEQVADHLLRAEKLATVGVLAAGIAHEVGTPLGVVRGRAEILLSRLGGSHPQAAGARIIVEEIDRISRTIRELLDFSRTSRADAVAVGLADLASNVVELLAFEARSRKVSLAVEVPQAFPALSADPDQLKQVLVNLTLNAIHACAAGGHVWLRAIAPGREGRATIEVVDDGAGIPDELRHRVFDPFFTTKKRGRGTGLGLTVAAQIARNHGGEIDLESAVGRGTRVVLRWPVSTREAEESDGQAERRAHSRGR